MLNDMPDCLDQIVHGTLVPIAKLNATLAGFHTGMSPLERFNAMIPTGIQGNMLFLICPSYPALIILVSRHPFTCALGYAVMIAWRRAGSRFRLDSA